MSNKLFLKAGIKPYSEEAKYLSNKEIPKVESNQTCLAKMSLDSALIDIPDKKIATPSHTRFTDNSIKHNLLNFSFKPSVLVS